jgi:hypothetical protein
MKAYLIATAILLTNCTAPQVAHTPPTPEWVVQAREKYMRETTPQQRAQWSMPFHVELGPTYNNTDDDRRLNAMQLQLELLKNEQDRLRAWQD